MTSLGDRIRQARKRARYSQARLGEIVGVTSQMISQYETNKSDVGAYNLVAIAAATNVSPQWLLTGEWLPQHNSTVTLVPGSVRVRGVPMLRADQVGRHLDGDLDYTDVPVVYAQFDCSERAYAIELTDASNAPRYDKGYRVIIDPAVPAGPGDMIHVMVGVAGKAQRLVFGEMRLEAGGVTVAAPLNPSWPAARSDLEPLTILGVMTEFAGPSRNSVR